MKTFKDINYSKDSSTVLEEVKELVALGINSSSDDNYAIKWASYCGHLKAVQFLANAGADIRASDDFALRFASSNGHLSV
ncbi:MAG: ankyrin repeat domain-containing protein, partial [Clostridiales bacterium]|nr:ankyrin repeat domain-containing protein [Clostridiales bacterium]